MQLLRGNRHFSALNDGTAVTIGNFDGVHVGHQALIRELQHQANDLNLPTLVVLFEPQPGEYFHKNQAPARLTPLREKLACLKQLGVDYVYCMKFDNTMAHMVAERFAHDVLFSQLHAKYFLVGQDFRFGRQRLGDVVLLKKIASQKHCTLELFDDHHFATQRVSSTRIREALAQSDLQQAERLLGRPFSMSGRVIKGEGRGRQWGIPTANIQPNRLKLPLQGVFCVQVTRHNGLQYEGVANLGYRPTVDGVHALLEVHLLDFDASLYGERLNIKFLHKLRNEVKFTSLDDLIAQIKTDIEKGKQYFLGNDSPRSEERPLSNSVEFAKKTH